jgi:cytochrome c oxidase subunit 3
MQQGHKNKKMEIGSFTFSKMEKVHPYKMLLYLVMLGGSFIFLFLVFAYNISQPYSYTFEYFRIPRAFVLSTLILLSSSFLIQKVVENFKKDDLKRMQFAYASSILLGITFIVVQSFGWNDLIKNAVIINGLPTDHYVYFIFGIHSGLFLLGLAFAVYQYYNIFKMPKDPVYALILFTNPFEKMKIDLLVQFWHFTNISWMALFLYFLFAF